MEGINEILGNDYQNLDFDELIKKIGDMPQELQQKLTDFLLEKLNMKNNEELPQTEDQPPEEATGNLLGATQTNMIKCDCGSEFMNTKAAKARHEKSKKHLKFLENKNNN